VDNGGGSSGREVVDVSLDDHDDMQAQAAQWHARVLVGDVDWDAFAQWLDAHPGHRATYDRLALLEDQFTRWAREHAPPEAAASPVLDRTLWRRMGIAAGAVAAVVAVVIAVPLVRDIWQPPTTYYSAQAGQRQIELAGGTQVSLDRRTRIAVVSGSTQRVAVLEGAAYFDVRHDDGRPLEVEAGDYVIRDIGTRFAVTRRDAQASVAVAQGLVDVSWPGHSATRLSAGQILDATGRGSLVEIRSIDPTMVAGWRDGRLAYDNAPLSLVAADISRYTAEPVDVDASVANIRLSGVLLVKNGTDLVHQIEAYLPVEAHREAGRVRFVGKPGPG
jgi:transmembrane sensor